MTQIHQKKNKLNSQLDSSMHFFFRFLLILFNVSSAPHRLLSKSINNYISLICVIENAHAIILEQVLPSSLPQIKLFFIEHILQALLVCEDIHMHLR